METPRLSHPPKRFTPTASVPRREHEEAKLHGAGVKARRQGGSRSARLVLRGVLAAGVLLLGLGASSRPALAQAPEGGAPLPRPAAAKPEAPAAPKELSPEERAQRGIVVLERGGQILGLGSVLGGDGRILTALSPLGHGNDLEVRYADGKSVRVKLGHHDRMWDLALLVPQSGKWREGFTASTRDPLRQDAALRSYSMTRGKPAGVAMLLRARRTLLGGDDKKLEGALEIGSRVAPSDLGAPILDEDQKVVGVVGRGCAPNEDRPCTPVAFGVPVTSVRNFLRTAPAAAVAPAAWLGIQGVSETGAVVKGVRVTVVHPESPADEAKLKGGDRNVSDMILAVDGKPVTSPESLAEVMRTFAVGDRVPLLVFGKGKYREVSVLLRAAPEARAVGPAAPAHPAELPSLPAETPRKPAPAR